MSLTILLILEETNKKITRSMPRNKSLDKVHYTTLESTLSILDMYCISNCS